MCPILIPSATEVCAKFTETFSHAVPLYKVQLNYTKLYSTLLFHNVPTETAIPQFMENFRASFPDSSISITPKMHLL